jgi:hypothetical protein
MAAAAIPAGIPKKSEKNTHLLAISVTISPAAIPIDKEKKA